MHPILLWCYHDNVSGGAGKEQVLGSDFPANPGPYFEYTFSEHVKTIKGPDRDNIYKVLKTLISLQFSSDLISNVLVTSAGKKMLY